MTPYYERDGITIYVGDNRDVLPHIGQVSAVVTDPPYGLSFMGKGWDHSVPGIEFWQAISAAMLPGAHLLACGGTRTYHRMAVAIEDAGYEIRDTLQWIYGSGFPKSHDVSKAIDKLNGRQFEDRYALGRHIRERRMALGLTCADINAWFGYRDGCQHWERQDPSGARVPTLADWQMLKQRLHLSDEWLPLVERVEAEREVLSTKHDAGKRNVAILGTQAKDYDITAPATPAAEQWQGWGTALKPAYEPIIMARKPLRSADINVLEMVYLQLREQGVTGDIAWKSERASGAGKRDQRTSSSSTDQPQVGGTSASPAVGNGTPKTGQPMESKSASTTAHGGHRTGNIQDNKTDTTGNHCGERLSPHMEAIAPVAGKHNSTSSPSTTSTAVEHRTESQSTARSTTNCDGSDIQTATEFSVGIAIGPQGSTETVRITRDADGLFIWPDALPKTIKGQNLTVAANVLQHGTGAINVDACRIGTEGGTRGSNFVPNSTPIYGKGFGGRVDIEQIPAGRWPSNIILDEAAAEGHEWSRFFYVAKASRRERNLGLDGMPERAKDSAHFATPRLNDLRMDHEQARRPAANSHPTVKPLALMRYLIQMVTPPGGIVLDPFMGSGSTLVAAAELGFHAIGIELDPEYAEIAARRIDHALNQRAGYLPGIEGVA